MGRESLRSVRGEKHIFKMLKDSSPQGVTAECGVNRAAGAGGQIGHFSLDFAVMMHLCCGPARATAASSSKSPPLVARFDLRRGAPHLTPPRAPPPEPSCGRPMYGEDRRVACKFRSTIPVGAFGRVWFVPWRARRAKMWPFLHGAACGDFPRSAAFLAGVAQGLNDGPGGQEHGPSGQGLAGVVWGINAAVSCGRPLVCCRRFGAPLAVLAL